MVDKFQQILERIMRENGEVIFFGIFKMDEFTDKWSVLLSAEWLTEDKRGAFFSSFTSIIKEALSEEEAQSIARVGLFSVDDHLIDLLLNYRTGSRILEQPINGNVIHEGYILVSNRKVESRLVAV